MALVKEISLTKVLSFGEKTTISLEPLNILIGMNGSGKSNLVDVFNLLRAAPTDFQKPIREGGGVREWLWKGSKASTPSVEINVVFENDIAPTRNIRYVLAFSETQQRFCLIDERIEYETLNEKEPCRFYCYNGKDPYLNINGTMQSADNVIIDKSIFMQIRDSRSYPEITFLGNQLQQIAIYRNWAFGRGTPPRMPQSADMPNTHLAEDCSNLGLVLKHFQYADNSTVEHILEVMSNLNGGIEDFDVNIEGGTVQLFMREDGMTIPAPRMSDGTLRFLCLAAVLCDPSPPPLICIEEPELGLHPDAISSLAELLVDASKRTQLIVTTHSSMLVDCFTETPECVLITEKDRGSTDIKRLSREELSPWLDKYRLGQLWMQGEFGGVRW